MPEPIFNQFNLLARPIAEKTPGNAPDEALAVISMLRHFQMTSFHHALPMAKARRQMERILTGDAGPGAVAVTKARHEPQRRFPQAFLMGVFFRPANIAQADLGRVAATRLPDLFSDLQRQKPALDDGVIAVTAARNASGVEPILGYFATGRTLSRLPQPTITAIMQR